MRENCPEPKPECKYFPNRCFSDIHHYFHPASDYKTAVEQSFRSLPENIGRLCRMLHEEEHATTKPPEKPDRETMLNAIRDAKIRREI